MFASADQLLSSLLRDTVSGKIRWTETQDPGSFRVALGGGELRLSRERGGHCADVLDASGRVVERIAEGDTPVELAKLFAAARRSALDVEGLLEKMLTDLNVGGGVAPVTAPDAAAPPGRLASRGGTRG